MRCEQFIHSLVRVDNDGNNTLPENQKIGSFAGFKALLCKKSNEK